MPAAPTITIRLPQILRSNGNGTAELVVPVGNVRAALQQVEQQRPELYRGICDETGRLRRHINVFVNSSYLSRQDGLETMLSPGDVVTIMPSVSGG
jgi:molybdopterin converting factor small subunit